MVVFLKERKWYRFLLKKESINKFKEQKEEGNDKRWQKKEISLEDDYPNLQSGAFIVQWTVFEENKWKKRYGEYNDEPEIRKPSRVYGYFDNYFEFWKIYKKFSEYNFISIK